MPLINDDQVSTAIEISLPMQAHTSECSNQQIIQAETMVLMGTGLVENSAMLKRMKHIFEEKIAANLSNTSQLC